MKALVVGATGKYAHFVIPELKQRGATVRALVREESKIDAAKQQGADEVAIGDLSEPESLRAAASERDAVFYSRRTSHHDRHNKDRFDHRIKSGTGQEYCSGAGKKGS
jgi:uncharacterized protein YbjT (DUF2867 family)